MIPGLSAWFSGAFLFGTRVMRVHETSFSSCPVGLNEFTISQMLTRQTSATVRLDFLRQVVREVREKTGLTPHAMATACKMDPSLFTRHFLADPPLGRPRAPGTLNVLRFVCHKRGYLGPLPTWRCLQLLQKESAKKELSQIPHGDQLAVYLGISKSQASQYIMTGKRVPDGEIALHLLSFWYSYRNPFSYLHEYLRYECVLDIDWMKSLSAPVKEDFLKEAQQIEDEVKAYQARVRNWERRPCPSWLQSLLNVGPSLIVKSPYQSVQFDVTEADER